MISQRAITGQIRRDKRARERGRNAWWAMTKEQRVEHARVRNSRQALRRKAGLSKPQAHLTNEQRILRLRAKHQHFKARNKQITDHYKSQHPCVDCGFSDIRALQFDHRDRSKKLANVSYLMKHCASTEKLMAEIAKCDVRCANCHFIRSAEERHHLPVTQAA